MTGLGHPEESNLALTYRDTAYIAANFTEFGQERLSRIIKWDGTKYSNFIEGSYSPVFSKYNEDGISSFAVDSIGQFFIGGVFDSIDGRYVGSIAMWNGSKWVDLKGGIKKGRIKCIEVYPEGVIAAGTFDSIGGVKVNNIARWDGSSWHSLDTGIKSITSIYSIARKDTNIYAIATGVLWIWNGTTWKKEAIAVSGQSTDAAYLKSVVSDGKSIYICGAFDSINGIYAKCVAVKQDSSWLPIGNYKGKRGSQIDCAGGINNKLFVRGYFSFYQGNDTLGAMLFFDSGLWKGFAKHPFGPYGHITFRKDEILVSGSNGYGFVDSSTPLMPTGLLVIKNDSITKYFSAPDQSGVRFAPIDRIVSDGKNVYILGDPGIAGLQYADSLMSWSGSKWQHVNGLNELLGGKRKYYLRDINTSVGRLFVSVDSDPHEVKTGEVFGIAMLDSLGWHALSETDFEITGRAIIDGFSVNSDGNVAAFGNYGITVWENGIWTKLALPFPPSDTVNISTILYDHDSIYVDCYMSTAIDGTYKYKNNVLIKWDGNTWIKIKEYILYFEDKLGSLYPAGGVKSLSKNNSIIYLSGSFTHVDSVQSEYIFALNEKKIIGFGKGPSSVNNGYPQVHSVIFHNNDLYICGEFDHASDTKAVSIAKWDGATWHALGSGVTHDRTVNGVQINGTVNSMCIFDNKLYIAGDFERAGGKNAHNISYYTLPEKNSVASNQNLHVNEKSLLVFPNPARTKVTIHSEETMNMVSIIDELGRVVREQKHQSKEIELNCSELPSGTYYIEAQLEGGSLSRGKFVIY